jgi:hypothetical protein
MQIMAGGKGGIALTVKEEEPRGLPVWGYRFLNEITRFNISGHLPSFPNRNAFLWIKLRTVKMSARLRAISMQVIHMYSNDVDGPSLSAYLAIGHFALLRGIRLPDWCRLFDRLRRRSDGPEL